MTDDYVEFHARSAFSFLEGASLPEALVAQAAKLGILALGILDRDGLYGAPRLAFGLGPVFWLLISEIYPLAVRGAAMSAATVANWAMNLVVAVAFLTLVHVVGRSSTFWIYGAITVCAWIFIYKLVPETKGKTLEQIEAGWRGEGAEKTAEHESPSVA